MRICPGCKVPKPNEDYRRQPSAQRKDGYTSRCKECLRSARRAWNRANGRVRRPGLFTDERAQEMIALYQGGQTAMELAKVYGCSQPTVWRALRRFGAAPRRAGYARRFTDEQAQELAVRYSAGQSTRELARIYNCNRQTVVATLRRSGVSLRPGGRTPQTPPDIVVADIVRRYEGGETMDELARSLDIGKWIVGVALRDAGVSIRCGGKRLADISAADLVRRYEGGETPRKLISRFHINWRRVQLTLRDAGVSIRPRGLRGPLHPNWKGGRYLNPQGYMVVTLPRGHPHEGMATKNHNVLEHRLVMAEFLGRPLQGLRGTPPRRRSSGHPIGQPH